MEQGKARRSEGTLEAKDIWAIRVRLQIQARVCDLASKLRDCDLVKLRVRDVCHGDWVASRATALQQKTQRPVQFEITPSTREAVEAWIKSAELRQDDHLFASRLLASSHLHTRQYARIVEGWVEEIGLDPAGYGTHSIRRTKPTLIYRRIRNLTNTVENAVAWSGSPHHRLVPHHAGKRGWRVAAMQGASSPPV